MTLVQIRKEQVISLCKVGQVISLKRGRPSKEIENNIKKERKLGTKKGEVAPTKDIRLDEIQYWAVDRTIKTRCKMLGCDSYTLIKCSKCDKSLCCGKNRVCFTNYHTNRKTFMLFFSYVLSLLLFKQFKSIIYFVIILLVWWAYWWKLLSYSVYVWYIFNFLLSLKVIWFDLNFYYTVFFCFILSLSYKSCIIHLYFFYYNL